MRMLAPTQAVLREKARQLGVAPREDWRANRRALKGATSVWRAPSPLLGDGNRTGRYGLCHQRLKGHPFSSSIRLKGIPSLSPSCTPSAASKGPTLPERVSQCQS
jgi:hypothetical protein